MKKFIAFLLFFVTALTLIGCGGDKEVTDITFNIPKQAIVVGEKITVTVTVEPSDVTSFKLQASMVTSSAGAASVSVSGKSISVTGTKVGLVKIKVSVVDTTVSKEFEIEVLPEEQVLPTKLAITNKIASITEGDTHNFTVTFTPSTTTNKNVIWTSSDTEVLTVANGVLTAVKPGTATVTAKSAADESILDTVEVTVKAVVLIDVETIVLKEPERLVAGHTFKITATITPVDANYSFKWETSNPSVATIDDNGNVTCLTAGEITITLTDTRTEISASFTKTVEATPVLVGLKLNSREIEIEENVKLVATPDPQYALFSVTWETSDSSILSVNPETGDAVALAVGSVTVTATDTATQFSVSATITVNPKFDPNAKPEQILITGETLLYVGYSTRYTADVLPIGVNSNVVWESSNTNVGTIDVNTGMFHALAPGLTRIKAYSVLDDTIVSKAYSVEVIELPPEEPDQDLKGYVIEFMQSEPSLHEIDPFLEGYSGSDKAAKIQAWNEIQDRFNCTIKAVPYPSEVPWHPNRAVWLVENANNGTSLTDFAIVSAAWMKTMIEGSYDLTAYYNKYGKGQFEPAIKETGTRNGKLYAVSTGVSISRNYPIFGLFYNYGMLEQLGLESPAKLFNEGRWTYSDFLEYCRTAQASMPQDSWVLSGAPSLYWSGMVNASGVKIADTKTMTLNLKHKYSYEALTTLNTLAQEGYWDVDGIEFDEKVVSFRTQKALFQPGEYWFVYHSMRWPRDLFGADTRYGYVPFPWADSIQKDQTRLNFSGESIICMMQGRSYPAGVDAEGVYRAFQTMYLRTNEIAHSNPLFNGEEIKENNAKGRIDDPQSVAATTWFTADKTFFDPFFDGSFQHTYTGETYAAVSNIILRNTDAAEEMEAIYDAVLAKFYLAFGSGS